MCVPIRFTSGYQENNERSIYVLSLRLAIRSAPPSFSSLASISFDTNIQICFRFYGFYQGSLICLVKGNEFSGLLP